MARGKESIYHSFPELPGPDSTEETNSNSPGEKELSAGKYIWNLTFSLQNPILCHYSLNWPSSHNVILHHIIKYFSSRFSFFSSSHLKTSSCIRTQLHFLRSLAGGESRMRRCHRYVCIIWQFMTRKGILQKKRDFSPTASNYSLNLNNALLLFADGVLEEKHGSVIILVLEAVIW